MSTVLFQVYGNEVGVFLLQGVEGGPGAIGTAVVNEETFVVVFGESGEYVGDSLAEYWGVFFFVVEGHYDGYSLFHVCIPVFPGGLAVAFSPPGWCGRSGVYLMVSEVSQKGNVHSFRIDIP